MLLMLIRQFSLRIYVVQKTFSFSPSLFSALWPRVWAVDTAMLCRISGGAFSNTEIIDPSECVFFPFTIISFPCRNDRTDKRPKRRRERQQAKEIEMIRRACISVSHVSLFQFGVWPIRLFKIPCRYTSSMRHACLSPM